LSAVVVPLGAVVLLALIVALDFVQAALLKSSEYVAKFHGQTSTNPAEFIRVPLDALEKLKSPAPSSGIWLYTTSSLYPEGIITKDACSNKLLIKINFVLLVLHMQTPLDSHQTDELSSRTG
jgi:hypothetical protein